MRLRIELIPGWTDISQVDPEGPLTFVRDASEDSGALQVSIQAEYVGGNIPDASREALTSIVERVALKDPAAEFRGSSTGVCALGQYGTILVSLAGFSWFQVWVLSNGRDFVLATHTCSKNQRNRK
jgi:hypothetical protein